MEKIEYMIEKFYKNKREIDLDEILELDLNESEYEYLISKLEQIGKILISEDNIKINEETNYNYSNHLYYYYQSIKSIPRLKFEEERTLIKEYQQTKDLNIRQKIIESNLKLVFHVAKPYIKYLSNPDFKYNMSTIDAMDLIQEGNKGIIKALEKFDLSKESMFSTYAAWWIRQGMLRYLQNNSRIIRLPIYIIDDYNKIEKYCHETYKEKGYNPNTIEISENLGMKKEQTSNLEKYNSLNMVSLDTEKIIDDGEYSCSYNMVDDICSGDELVEVEVLKKLDVEKILKVARKILNDNQYKIFSMTFGIQNEFNKCSYPLTNGEIRKELNLTSERVRQIQERNIEKIIYYLKTGRKRKPRRKVKQLNTNPR